MALHTFWLHTDSEAKHKAIVHSELCECLSRLESRTSLGVHVDCWSALRKAQMQYADADVCASCSPSCWTGAVPLTESQSGPLAQP